MSSTRPKLILDEQAFQGLLAAAFTIQEHNDRKKRDSNSALAADKTSSTAEPAELCGHCGALLPPNAASCKVCGEAKLRPGERLQRNWASMWLMSQEQGQWPEHSERGEADSGVSLSSRDGNGRHPADSARVVSLTAVNVNSGRPSTETPDSAVGQPSAAVSAVHHFVPDFSQRKITWEAENPEDSELAFPSDELSVEESLVPEDFSLDDASPKQQLLADSQAGPEADSLSTLSDRFRDLRVKLRFHRADLYLALAIFVAALALLWPAAASLRPTLPAWQRMLIAMGIAEAPAPPVHYRGDPQIKVWVDTHAALYYCPGDELYGKSADGHFTTQREAQADDFEPAQRSACIQ